MEARPTGAANTVTSARCKVFFFERRGQDGQDIGGPDVRSLDLFSGIGGIALGFERAGIETAAFCEIDHKCRRVLRRHWPEVPIYEDVRDIGANRLARDGVHIDLIAGGFPCQPFSTAARGRNNKPDLWPEQLRLLRELRPRWLLAENVPGFGYGGVDRVCSDVEREGYAVWPFRLDTAPPGRHRGRDRFIILANANRKGKPRRAEHEEVAGLPDLSRCSWADDPAPVGVDDGVPGRMDGLRQLGNAVTPWASEIFGRAIMRADY